MFALVPDGPRDEAAVGCRFRPARPSRCATRALPAPQVQPHLAPRLADPRAHADGRLGGRSLSGLGRARGGQDAAGAGVRPRAVERRAIGAVVVACPTAPLTRQWARAAHDLGIDLAPDADSPKPPSGFHGVSVTYARVAKAPARWARALPRRTLVIADEAHHLGEDLTWGVAFAKAFAECPRWLLLSGTPFRSDATPIPGVSYDADGMAEPDVSYSYAEAVADAVCRPVCFVAYDGSLSWRSGDDVIESSFETVLSTREASRRYRTAISTDLPDGLPRILKEADAKLEGIRQDGHRDAAGLVVAADSEHARRIAKLLREATGRVPVVVLHAETRAAAKLAAFTSSTDPWIVAVNMVSEGVDIPRLRVGVYATAAKTPLIFRQIVGRFVRTLPAARSSPAGCTSPPTRSCATTRPPSSRSCAGHCAGLVRRTRSRSTSAPSAGETERSDTPEFVPLSADVAPQMTLFGAPAPPPQSAAARWAGAMADPEPAGGGRRERDPRDPGVRAAGPAARRAPPPGV